MSINSILTSVFPAPLALDILNMSMSTDCFFGSQEWARYFGDVGVVPPLPRNLGQILASPCPFWKGKKVEETHMLVLIPQTVDGRGFCLNTLGELIGHPKTGHKAVYNSYDPYVQNEWGDKTFPSHWVLMTRDVIPGSRRLPYESQAALVHAHALRTEIPYEVPTALEAATTILMEHVQTGTGRYSANPFTLTRCQETVVKDQWHVLIGSLSPGRLQPIEVVWHIERSAHSSENLITERRVHSSERLSSEGLTMELWNPSPRWHHSYGSLQIAGDRHDRENYGCQFYGVGCVRRL